MAYSFTSLCCAMQRVILGLSVVFLAIAGFMVYSSSGAGASVTLYSSPTCNCCGKWAAHLEAEGFTVETTHTSNMAQVKRQEGIPYNLGSCHTAVIEGYRVEGHVPAAQVKRLLEERPDIRGLAVPGMPIGSPGMESPNPEDHETYDVIAFGGTEGDYVFATVTP
ncbi:MAG: DUF411 domain-containing protein [Bacteroidetes bacterium]|nr:DUF411 domain-containing protein [Bacteroidota bacterium]